MTARRIVVVGAGGSGIPLAARLGCAGHEVVLLEAGPAHATHDPALQAALHDAWTVRAGLPDAGTTWTYDADLHHGRPWRIARGRGPGGSTAVNGAYFQRPHPDDFTRWAAVAGTEWSYEACLPALRRLESDHDFTGTVHGVDGPVPVRRTGHDDVTTQGFLAAAIAAGAVHEDDKNAGGASGVGLLPRNALDGRRWGTDHAYAELLTAGSVDARSGATVQRVVFRDRIATGVEVTDGGTTGVLEADEVILCAGAIATPQLLRASGVGAAGEVAGDTVAALRGVGRGLSDHAAIDLAWTAAAGIVPAADAAWTAAWNAPAGQIGDAAVELLLAVLPTAAIVSGDRGRDGARDLRITLAEPASRGVVTDRVRYGYLAAAGDLVTIREAVRTAAGLLRAPELAGIVAAADIPDWVFAAHSDDAADEWIRAHLGTALHSCGTARMGPPDDPDAVADAHGRVHAVAGLRVADASLLPVVPTRGTALAAVLIGERIAELIASE